MPTKNPRILVTLDQKDLELVRRIALAFDTSLSGAVRWLVAEVSPALVPMIEAMELAQKAPQEALQKMRTAMHGAASDMSQLHLEIDAVDARLKAGSPVIVTKPKGMHGRRGRPK